MKRFASLDVVRGIAILMVLIWHYVPRSAAMPDYILYPTRLFWSGVDMFFVLSGFLIAGILLKNRAAENYFAAFYLRRAARILPLYLVLFLSFVVVRDLKIESIDWIFQAPLPMWSYLTFTQNFFYGARGEFGDPWMDVTWSLAMEEQFYIFLSLFIFFLNKRWLTIASLTLVILAPILRLYADSPLIGYVYPLHRADSLMLGVLLALAWHTPRGREFIQRKAAWFAAALPALLAGYLWLTLRNTYIGDAPGHFLLALLYLDFVILALVVTPPKADILFKNPFLLWLGLRSYGIYLLHKPVYYLVTALLEAQSLTLNLAGLTLLRLALLAFVVEISYRYFEKPILEFAQQHFQYKNNAPLSEVL